MNNSNSPSKLILQGAPNFRDLGGTPATNGRILRHGIIYRSEGPKDLTESDVELLRTVNFRTIFDLRSKDERLAVPNAWCKGTRANIINLNVSPADLIAASSEDLRILYNDESARGIREVITQIYCAMAKTMIPHLNLLFNEILDKNALPILIHCTAGKDRTGFIVALLLLALGIDLSTVKADYLLSSECVSDRIRTWYANLFIDHFGFRLHENILKEILHVRLEYLESALTSIDDLAGSVEKYLKEHVGLSETRMQFLRDKLLVDG